MTDDSIKNGDDETKAILNEMSVEQLKAKLAEKDKELKLMCYYTIMEADCSNCRVDCSIKPTPEEADKPICKYCKKPIDGELGHLFCEPYPKEVDKP